MGITEGIINELKRIVGESNIITDEVELTVYEADGSFVYTAKPDVVVFPRSAEEVAKVVRVAWENRIPIVGRGSGTSLSGGALPIEGGIVVSLARMNRVLELDIENETATVEAGVINLWVSDALAKLNYQYPIDLGYYFPADPGSQRVATIGGNISHNAGGVKCFKYGVTVNNVRGLKVVLPNGEIRFFGGKVIENPGYDIVGIISGSEGTMAIVTEAVLRIVSNYESVKTILAAFNSIEDAGTAVSRIISTGIRPVALEFMDKIAVNAIEAGPWGGGLPTDAEAILLIDVEGSEPGTSAEANRIIEILKSSGAYMVKLARDRAEANKWWGAILTGFFVVGLAYVFNYSGMAYSLAYASSLVGLIFVIISPFLGFIGAALSGSNTASNTLFGALQAAVGKLLGLPVPLLPAANSVGSELGKPVAPQTVSVGVSTTPYVRKEGIIVRRNLPWAIMYVFYLIFIISLYAFVFPWAMPKI
ncbi:MAG: FAD-binding protein [Vulcanisaeta sp.]|jgi:glycolate oxidase|uniref:FAD-binding oxidoreductase n=1 Tax=Vulcanisaeta sp. TaxID=2020871 RepID=UPI003D152489